MKTYPDAAPLYEAGITQQEIADRFGTSTSTISRELGRLGVQTRVGPRPRTWSDEQLATATAMREAGANWTAIGRYLGVSREKVRQLLAHVPRGERPSRYACPGCGIPMQVYADACGFCVDEAEGNAPYLLRLREAVVEARCGSGRREA